MTVRTRIAPSPTGFLHLGTARTALFSWAFAQHHKGQFVLRIEDTDLARNSQESVDQIIEAMQWLGLSYDEGPFYQMQRLARYREVIGSLIAAGHAYFCYASPAELEAMRERQRLAGELIGYDGTWRPEPGKALPPMPADVKPVVRFKSPKTGSVGWTDLVKGEISFENKELDDLIIARPSEEAAEAIGIPTYNFCVVIDDWDMRISHVFRGDEHVNNTPRQIHIFNALGAPLPSFGHLPIILGDDGLKLSKRRGAVSVMSYADDGYLPEAMGNYLARLGWSHGDDEVFSTAQMIAWFDGSHLAQSPAQWDAKKLDWINAQYIKACDPARLEQLVTDQLEKQGVTSVDARLGAICALFKDRCSTTRELAAWARAIYVQSEAPEVDEAGRIAISALCAALRNCEWTRPAIAAAIKGAVSASGLKMPQLAMPARAALVGQAQAPSLDAILELFGKEEALRRLSGA